MKRESNLEKFIIFETLKKIGRVEVRFILRGEKGAISFICPWFKNDHPLRWELAESFISYHSRKPLYKSHTKFGSCPYLDGEECYFEVFSLTDEYFNEFSLSYGEEKVWQHMEWYYHDMLEPYYPEDR